MMRWLPLLGLLVSLTACDGPVSPAGHAAAPPTPPPEAPAHIQTAIVAERASQPVLTLAGRVAYAEDRFSRVSSPVQGRVIEVRAKLGDRVNAGDVLLVLDSPDIAEAYAEFVKEHSDLSYATRAFELAVDLYRLQAIPFRDYKQAENDLVKDQAAFNRAKERLLSLKVPASELDKPLTQQHIISRFELKSPLPGTVVERNVTPGESVGGDPAQVLFTIVDLDTLQVAADVYESDLGLIKVGQVATATVEAAPGVEFPAAIAAIGDLVDPASRTIKVRAWVNNQDRRLKPEMFARLHVPIGDETPFITLPSEAVFESEGGLFVYVQDGPSHYAPRAVKVQKLPDHQVRVLEGLHAHERVVVKGAVLLKAMLQRS